MAARRNAAAGNSSSMAAKRIRKEIADLAKENLGAITLTPNESNIFQWKATIPGPAGSPYEGGVFDVDVRIPEDYPFSPPQLQFLTKVYHCNISNQGGICLDLLKNAWSPALSLYKVILSLSSLLTDPNPSDPLVPSIAQEYKKNRKRHDETAREWVKTYAMPKAASKPPAEPTPPPRPARPRPVVRAVNNPTPPPPVAGTRRAAPSDAGNAPGNAIELGDDDDDVEVLGESSSVNGSTRPAPRRSKRQRVEASAGAGASPAPTANGTANGASDDVIVIDD